MTTRSNRGYNYEFQLILEGVPTKFISASIASTPNGNEATINIHSVESAFDIKPKSSVQIFYKEWWKPNPQWKLLFDGFTSRFDKRDDVQQGAGIAITCRDFRMDIRRTPCAMVFGGESGLEQLGTYATLNGGGLYMNYCYPGSVSKTKTNIKVYDNTQLADLYNIIRMVAGTAQNVGEKEVKTYSKGQGKADQQKDALKQNLNADSSVKTTQSGINAQNQANKKAEEEAAQKAKSNTTNTEHAPETDAKLNEDKGDTQPVVNYESLFDGTSEGHWFMDALIKGMWIEAVAATYAGQYMNRRLKTDKRLAAMKNDAGYKLFMQQQMSEFGATYISGNSRFTSIEAMLMRIAGLFMYRAYSVSSPPLIDLQDEEQRDFFCSPRVYKNYCSNEDMFGAPYMAPFTILTPPLEFTAPPNCNVFLPAMYNGVSWQHDDDAEITRGYFGVTNTFASGESEKSVWSYQIQVPNTILNYGGAFLNYEKSTTIDQAKSTEFTTASETTGEKLYEEFIKSYVAASPSMSLEERYKGVNISEGSVSDYLARNDLVQHIHHAITDAKAAVEIDAKIQKAIMESEAITLAAPSPASASNTLSKVTTNTAAYAATMQEVGDKVVKYMEKGAAIMGGEKNSAYQQANLTRVLEQHATVKFVNQKFAGRVAQIQMDLNPFPICGFPGILIADARDSKGDRFGFQTRKSIAGTVQQVQHTIHASGQAQTSIIMNNARYIDEPTYMNRDGLPTFMKPTLPQKAEFDIDEMKYKLYEDDQYFVGNDMPKYNYVRRENIETTDDIDISLKDNSPDYVYAKDFTTVSLSGLANGQSNLSYIDQQYAPNLITRFYVKCLRQKANNSLMLGSYNDTKGLHWYMYDSVHEAVNALEGKADIVYDYQRAMEFIERDVISLAGFYCGILDMAAVNTKDESGWTNMLSRSDFDKLSTVSKIDMSAFSGVSLKKWSKMVTTAKQDKKNNALIEQYGEAANIPPDPRGHYALEIEHSPSTAFTKERHASAQKYSDDITGYANAAKYAYD